MSDPITREPQYEMLVELRRKKGLATLGLTTNQMWHDDPRHLCFHLARYKFVAKLLSGKAKVLEIGCGDAFGTRLVQQEVGSVHAIDFDPIFVNDVNDRMDDKWRFECEVHDILNGPAPGGEVDAAYSIDLLEHIPIDNEDQFM
ncbi:MAG: class I SAM-dependent methyltransferase [Thermodesulfobacteriota bacterium]